jgi:hypothetical protein
MKIRNIAKSPRGTPDKRGVMRFARVGEVIDVDVHYVPPGFESAEDEPAEKKKRGKKFGPVKDMHKDELQEYLVANNIAYAPELLKPELLELALEQEDKLAAGQ